MFSSGVKNVSQKVQKEGKQIYLIKSIPFFKVNPYKLHTTYL